MKLMSYIHIRPSELQNDTANKLYRYYNGQKPYDTYFYTEMFVVEASKMQNRRAAVYTCKQCSRYSDNGNSVDSKV